MNRIVTKSKPIISWKIDERTAGFAQAELKWCNPFFVCFTPAVTDFPTQVSCEFRKISMGDVNFTSDPLSGKFKFEVVGKRNPPDTKESLVCFIPVQGISNEVMIRIHHTLSALFVTGNEIVVDNFSNVSWVVHDSMSLVVHDYELA